MSDEMRRFLPEDHKDTEGKHGKRALLLDERTKKLCATLNDLTEEIAGRMELNYAMRNPGDGVVGILVQILSGKRMPESYVIGCPDCIRLGLAQFEELKPFMLQLAEELGKAKPIDEVLK